MKLILATLLTTGAAALGGPFALTPGGHAQDRDASPVVAALVQSAARQGPCGPSAAAPTQELCEALERDGQPSTP